MGIEVWVLKDSENKKKKLDEKQIAEEVIKQKKIEVKNKEIRENIKAEEALNTMKEMINDEDLDLSLNQVNLIKKVIENDDISQNDIDEILEKIDEIEKTEDVDKYLPKEFRITWEEYKKALNNDIARTQTITKINTALTILANQVLGETSMWLNLFSGYMAMLDKKLIKIQENHIDIKDNLVEIDEHKNPKKQDSLSLWDRFMKFLKELFS